MSRLVFSPEARRDLEEIFDFIADDSPDRALAWVKRLERICRLVADQPGAGRARPELARSLRSVAEGRYVIFYRPVEDGVQIVRVLQGSRDLPAIFGSAES